MPYLDCTHCYYGGLIRPPSAELPPFCFLLVKPNEEVESPDCIFLCVRTLTASVISVPVLCSQIAEYTSVFIVELSKTFVSLKSDQLCSNIGLLMADGLSIWIRVIFYTPLSNN